MNIWINKLVNIGDEKGPVFNIVADAKEVPVFFRNKGTLFGNHYHTGNDSSNDPEFIYLIQGKIRFFAKNLSTGETMKETLDAPLEIVISSNIVHAYIALEDVIFIEPRTTIYDKEKPDTHENVIVNEEGEWL